MKRHLLFVQIKKYSMLKSSSYARAYFLSSTESRLADAQQECGGELISSDFIRGVHEDNAARERSARSSIFSSFLFSEGQPALCLLKQLYEFNSAECVAPFLAKRSDRMGYYPFVNYICKSACNNFGFV